MSKPEKKDYEKWRDDGNEDTLGLQSHYFDGYNQCWDDREKWLKELLAGIIKVMEEGK